MAFVEEAENLWAVEKGKPLPNSLSTLVALRLLGLGCLYQGLEEKGMAYVWEARKMAKFLRLLGADAETSVDDDFGALTSEQRRWLGQIAWGAFNWQSYVSSMPFSAQTNC